MDKSHFKTKCVYCMGRFNIFALGAEKYKIKCKSCNAIAAPDHFKFTFKLTVVLH